jgi:hypothetical protein
MNTIEQFETKGSHYEVGRAIGLHFAEAIHRLFDNYVLLQGQILPFYNTATGRSYYQSLLKLHRNHFPGYVSELEGIAEGAMRPFEEVFLVNLRGEFAGLVQLEVPTEDTAYTSGQGCTDCLVLTPDAALIGHNEDGTPASLGNMFVVRITVGNGPTFSALCYPGFLPGNAFGFNEYGMLHTVNHVAPRRVRVGLGRHFIARSLLEARSLDDAIRRITAPGRAAGFNYNIGLLSDRRMVSVEVSPDRHHIHEIQGYYLHTNHYLELLDEDQEITPSSRTRLERARMLCQNNPPADASRVLAVIGDKTDGDYPIHCDAKPPDVNATLCSALYDLDNRQLRIYWDHPVREPEKYIRLAL